MLVVTGKIGNSYVSGAQLEETTGIEIRWIANNSLTSRKLSFNFIFLRSFGLSKAQRKPAQLVDGLIPPKTLFPRNNMSLHPEFAGYGVLGQSHILLAVANQKTNPSFPRENPMFFRWKAFAMRQSSEQISSEFETKYDLENHVLFRNGDQIANISGVFAQGI